MDPLDVLKNMAQALADMQVLLADTQAAVNASYKKGFDDGVASVPVAAPAPVDPALPVDEQVAALTAQVSDLSAKVAALQAQVDGFDAVKAAAVADAVAALKADIAKKIRDASVDDLAIAAELEA